MSATPCRNAHIDLLRGIAISSVLLLHFTLAYGLKNSPLGTLLPAWLLAALALNGNYGVTLFFAISGYLITANSLARWGTLQAIDLRQFYALRIARIMPPLLLALAIIVTLGCLGLPYFANTDNQQHLPASYFFIAAGSVLSFWHNVLMQSTGYFNYSLNIYWSLSVEEVFYLVMPLACRSLRRTGLLVAACLAAIACGPLYRAAHIDNEIFFMYAYPACFDAIAMGCLAALAARHLTLSGRAATVLRGASGAALLAVYLRGIGGHEVAGFSLIALAGACYLLGAAHTPQATPALHRLSRPLRWMGQHSYELYLFHIIVLAAMRNLVDKASLSYAARLPWLALFLALSCAAAALVARHLANPANRALRQRLLS